ncbi:alpha/beta hydrolase [Sphingomicrobium clamense]|uniref:Alpha/beta hydrolase n=1 Tax=Sphingomicrobium clamense TaxID=2851013 RepID=A0ABS6V3Y0_9SPHN|nr:alpha/beta hydrolase [Sphingomicrobium sp. B8]MBW0144257.1 alpha/beta hydrolase [Sphingomicrobium sp. B8]
MAAGKDATISRLAAIDHKLKRRLRRYKRRAMLAGEMSLWALGRVGLSPVAMLDAASRVKGDKDVRCLARGIPYGDDPRQRLDLWAPKKPGHDPLKVVIFFYGGGWVVGERGEFGYVGRALAQRGFLSVMPDYRLAPHARFPDFIHDGAQALKWVSENITTFGGDPDKIAIAGHSAGGHLAALLALDPRYLEGEGLDPAIIKAAALLSTPTNFYPFIDPRAIKAFGDHEPHTDTQPINFARADAPPILLQTGTADITVRARNSQQLAQALEDAGAEVDLKLYRGATHSDPVKAFSPLFTRYPIVENLVDWLNAKLA